MADWFHFTAESLSTWPRTRLLETQRELLARMLPEARYRANRADVEAKLAMVREELRRRNGKAW